MPFVAMQGRAALASADSAGGCRPASTVARVFAERFGGVVDSPRVHGIEDPSLWRRVHNLWISELYASLKPQVAGRLSLAIDQEITLFEQDNAAERLRPDLHATPRASDPAPPPQPALQPGATRAVGYAEGVEAWSTESRHFLVLRDLDGGQVQGVLEILSPTNKGHYGRLDLEAFAQRRQRLLRSTVCYLEVDAVAQGVRWLPTCLNELSVHAGVAWSSMPEKTGRRFRGWAWAAGGQLPLIPWDLGAYGQVSIDLERTLAEAMGAAGLRR